MGLSLQPTRRTSGKIATLIAVFALIAQPMYGLVAAHVASATPNINTFSTGFNDLTNWKTDRSAPSAGYAKSDSSLVLNIDGDNPDTRAGNVFYRTEGVKANLPTNVSSIKATLHIDESWEDTIGVRAGIWGVTNDPYYPIIEFSNRDDTNDQLAGVPVVRAWDSNVGWVQLVNNPQYGSDYVFEIVHDPITQEFKYYLNNSDNPAYTGQASANPLTQIIFNSYNSGVPNNNYSVNWTNFELGSYVYPAPANLHIVQNGAKLDSGHITKTASGTSLRIDPVAGIDRYEIGVKRPGATEFEYHHAGTMPRQLLVERDYFGNSNGEYEYTIRARNNAGIWSERSEPVSLIYDNTAPTIEPIHVNGINFSLDNSATVSGVNGLNFQFTIIDEFAGHDYTYAEVKKANGSWVQGTSGLHLRGSNPSWQIPANKTQDDGKYVLKLSTRDKLGNSKSVEYKFNIDNTIPTFSLMDGQNPRKHINDGDYVNLDRLSDNAPQSEQAYFSGKNSTDTLYLNGSPIFNHGYFEKANSGKIGAAFKTDGKYTLHTKNILGTESAKIAFTVDETLPVINTPQLDSGIVSGERTFEISQTEVNPDRTYVEYMEKDQNGDWKKKTGQWFNETNAFSYMVDTTNWGDGLHQIKISTWDKANNHTSATFVADVDNTAPEITEFEFQNLKNGKFNPTKIIARAADSESFVTDVYIHIYKKDGDKWVVQNANPFRQGNPDGRDFAEVTGLWKTDGVYKATAWAVDKAGNSSQPVESSEFIVDSIAPKVTITSPSADSLISGTVDIKATIEDENLSRYYLLVKTRASEEHAWSELYKETIDSGQFTDEATLFTIPGTVSGEVYVQLDAKDKAGNKDDADSVKKMFFVLDNSAPTASISLNSLMNPTFATVGISDLYSPQGSYVVNVLSADGPGSWRLCGPTDFAVGETSAKCTMLSTLLDGTYYLRANVLDAMGHNSAYVMPNGAALSDHFMIDTTRPTVSIDSINLTGDLLEVGVSGEDLVSGLLALGINIYDANNEGDALVSGLGRIKDNIAKGTLSDSVVRSDIDISALTDGVYTIRAVALDHAGLYSTQALGQFTVDRTAPAVSIDSMTFTTTGARTITGTVDDDATSVEASIDNGTTWIPATYTPGQTTWSFPVSSGLANGSYPILARATDNNGNTGNGREASAQASFTVAVVTNPAHTPAIEVNNSPQTEGTFTPNNTAQSVNALQVLPAGDTVVDSATDEEATDEDGEVAAAVTDNDDNGEVKAAEDVKDSWSLINLLLTIAVTAASIFALIGLAGKKEDRNIGARLLTVFPALGAGAVLLFAEDFSGQMSWVNIWTLLVGALLVVQMILLANTKTETE